MKIDNAFEIILFELRNIKLEMTVTRYGKKITKDYE